MSWEDLNRKEKPTAAPVDEDWLRLHLVVFGSGAGADLLAKYHAMIVDAVPAAASSESVVRDHEGQRRLIRFIEQNVARARELQKTKPAD